MWVWFDFAVIGLVGSRNGSRIGRPSYIEPNVEISGENTTGFVDEYERIEKELSLKQDSEIAVHSKVLDFANVLKLTFPEIGAEFEVFLENKETQQKMIDENKESRKRQRSLMIEKDNLEKKILDLLLFLQADSVENIQNLVILSNNQMKNIATLTKRFDKLKIDFTKRISALNREIDKQQQLFVEIKI